MNNKSVHSETIFVHSLFRSGSTYFYNALKRTGCFHVYHEPFHEVIGSLPMAWDEWKGKTEDLKEILRHDFLGGSYFDEYADVLPCIRETFDTRFSYRLFFLDKSSASKDFHSYIDCLISGAKHKPVIQCTRTVGRIEWLKEHYPSKHIFLLRNPWDQWYSYKVDNYISSTPQIIYSQPGLPSVLKDVATVCNFSQLPFNDVNDQLEKCILRPISPEVDYFLFFGLWMYAFANAFSACDVILDMDSISADETKRVDAEKDISNIGLKNVSLKDCCLHRTFFKEKEVSFYQEIEEQVLDIFRQNDEFANIVQHATEYLNRERGKTFNSSYYKNVDFKDVLEDSSRLRVNLIRLGNTFAQSIGELNYDLEEREGQIANLNNDLREREGQIANLNNDLREREGQVANLNNNIGECEGQIANLNNDLREREGQIANLNNDLRERDGQIVSLNDVTSEKDRQIAILNQEVTIKNEQLARFSRVLAERNIAQATIQEMQNSRSWKITAPFRSAGRFIRENFSSSKSIANNYVNDNNDGPSAFFTICSKNFMAHARVLYNSIRQSYPHVRFFLVLCDRLDGMIDPTQEPFEFVFLEDIGLPDLEGMATRYNITEFNTAIKPFAFVHLMEKFALDSVIYVDPDILFVDRMEELDSMLAEGAEAVLTPHILQPAEHDEVHDGKMLLFGIYNLGFLALRNTSNVRNFLGWWGRRLESQCVIRLEEGLFVDQKWADLLPAFVTRTRIIHHPGYNVAYWNLPQRKIVHKDGRWFANDEPLRFVHFSGNKIDDREVFSRHSQQVTVENIGDLRILLEYYCEQVFAQGHKFYRGLPYAFNWNGNSGTNLHTPETLDMSNVTGEKQVTKSSNFPSNSHISPINKFKARMDILISALPVARRLCGGWVPFMRRVWGAYKRNGWAYVKAKGFELSRFRAPSDPRIDTANEITTSRRLLYLDWAIPKPDQDAASVTAVQLMRIFSSLGYAVTFIPCGLKYEEGYFELLVEEGIDVVCYPRIESVEKWLNANAASFDICFMSRGPVVWPYLETLRRVAPMLRLIFNTVDLHYLRELRQAELSHDKKARSAALRTKDHELELIRKCDLTIVLSSEELYTIRSEVPEASLAVLPIVFQNIPGARKKFLERRDILFIGSFPHLPNIDAVIYFAENIFPLIQKRLPDVCFKVIGANPPERIQRLAINPNIQILGFVKDISHLFEEIRISIAPLRYGAGIKGKIGSSLCYGVPCVATSIAVEGMGLVDGRDVLVADSPEEFADAVFRAYTNEALWNNMSSSGFKFAVENYSVEVISERVRNILWSVQEGWRAMEGTVELDSWQSCQQHCTNMGQAYEKRIEREEALLPTEGEDSFETSGFCCVCGRKTTFLTSFMYSTGLTPNGKTMPNWREHMQCTHCGLVNRVRATIHALHTLATPTPESRIYVTEQVTPLYRWLKDRYQNIQGSEFLGDEHVPGALLNGLRHEDVMRLSFSDSSFDRILSLDVLEHVSDPGRAFREIYRVLDSEGVFIFTVPFASDSPSDIVRATLSDDGTVVHHLPAEYHGNPVDPEGGALCFRYFGWELLNELKSIGFVRVRALSYWSENQGYLGREQYLFIAHKPRCEVNVQ